MLQGKRIARETSVVFRAIATDSWSKFSSCLPKPLNWISHSYKTNKSNHKNIVILYSFCFAITFLLPVFIFTSFKRQELCVSSLHFETEKKSRQLHPTKQGIIVW